MAGLTAKTPSATYKDLLKVENSNSGVDDTLRQVESGDGTGSALYIEKNSVKIQPTVDDVGALLVKDKDGNRIFGVDTSNDLIAAVGHYVNTQYAHFNIGYNESAVFLINTHHPIPFQSANYGINSYPPAFGTGTDPATTFTTADSNNQRASDLVPVIWRVPDNITIDSVTHIEGADNATGDTTRMHLFSYTFASGSASVLTSGTVVAHSSDTTNAGDEQAYLKTWTIDSANIDSGKVILCLFRSDSINSDFSLNVTIKYHLR